MIKILVITGPTAAGKTALGIKLAKKFNGEIISADSRQVYKGNDVETGKDRSFFQWGIDIAEPGTDFNVSAFREYAQKTIADIASRGKLPIVVGGTGHYLRALLDPFSTINIPPDPKLRAKNLSVEELQKLVNPPAGGKMNPSDWQNPRRLIRAIETSKKRTVLLKDDR
ncbi:tRNA (adenosine(37)-N6)-dimethylallyltransferase MiaA, partial [Candidatus Microgenomates bacterium]|nr:tRNA (adenosine(37)-N6)-dimethylallyltransferase MiaA [Candidatus Microgenomates bacterium]